MRISAERSIRAKELCNLIHEHIGLPAAHRKSRLMLLGSPPDMVHGIQSHRAYIPVYQIAKHIYLKYYTIIQTKNQDVLFWFFKC